MPASAHNDARGHTRGHEARLDSCNKLSYSIRGWATGVDHAMQDMPLSSSNRSDKQESSSASYSDIQFDTLMAEYVPVREKIEQIEDKIAELYYERQRDGDIASCASSHAKTSESQEGPGNKIKPRLEKRRDSPLAFSDYDDYSHGDKVKEKVKNRKAKTSKTKEEQNRHINKVFMRENM